MSEPDEKKYFHIGPKIIGAAFFVLLMFVNLKIDTSPVKSGDINLLGVNISLSTPSAQAYYIACAGNTQYCAKVDTTTKYFESSL